MDQWYYLGADGQASGPVDFSTLKSALESGSIPTSTRVNRAGTEEWVAASAVPEFVAEPLAKHARSAKATTSNGLLPVVIGLGALVAVLLVVVAVLFSRDSTPRATTSVQNSSPSSKSTAPTATPPPVKSRLEELQEMKTMKEALSATQSKMGATIDKFSGGGVEFALWAVKRMTWADVHVTRNETSVGAIFKDPEAELGKRICAPVTIVQISTERTAAGKLYEGVLMTGAVNVFKYIAVGSTGDLVAKDQGRFCGIITGTLSYGNVNGGQTHAVAVVGMFDLPQNK